jgi:proteasome assembly chaperone (PAC2) family protein
MMTKHVLLDDGVTILPSLGDMVHLNIVKSVIASKNREIERLTGELEAMTEAHRHEQLRANMNERYRDFYDLYKELRQ